MASPVPSTTLPDVSVTAPAATSAAMRGSSYVERIITLIIRLGTGSFGGSGANTITLGPIGSRPYSSLRCSVVIQNAPTPHPGMAIIRVYGLTLDQINQLTIAGTLWDGRKNYITIQAGTSASAVTTIYTGMIWQAYPEAAQPEMAFVMLTNPANDMQLAPQKPISFSGPIDGVSVLTQMLQSTGLTLENNGVSAILSNPYFAGSSWDQIKAVTTAMNCYGYLDSVRNVYAIWPLAGNRSGAGTPMISAATGMIGYPEFQQAQIKVRVIYDPSLTLTPGGKIQVQSDFKAATGMWTVSQSTLSLAAQTVDGPWEVAVIGNRIPGQ